MKMLRNFWSNKTKAGNQKKFWPVYNSLVEGPNDGFNTPNHALAIWSLARSKTQIPFMSGLYIRFFFYIKNKTSCYFLKKYVHVTQVETTMLRNSKGSSKIMQHRESRRRRWWIDAIEIQEHDFEIQWNSYVVLVQCIA